MKHPLLISVAVLAWTVVGGEQLPAQQVPPSLDLSLNLLYDDPMDSQSGGDWQVVGRADHNGIMAVNAELMNIVDPQFHAPRGEVGGVPVGFEIDLAVDFATHFQLVAAQVPQGSAAMQPLFYDVGVIGGGTQPGDVGPVMELDEGSERGIPWGMSDPLGDAGWDGAVLLFSGTFNPGVTPAFYSDENEMSAGLVFTSVGDEMVQGTVAPASITTIVRSNLVIEGILGDYNGSGLVEQGDLDLVLSHWGEDATTPPANWVNDLPSGFIDQAELDRVLSSWGESGAALVGTANVPEPGTLLLAAMAFIPWVIRRGGLGMGRPR